MGFLHQCGSIRCLYSQFSKSKELLRTHKSKIASQSCHSTVTKSVNRRTITETGKVSPICPVPDNIDAPPYIQQGKVGKYLREVFQKFKGKERIEIKTAEQIQGMRDACRVARSVLNNVAGFIEPGVTTDQLDTIVHKQCVDVHAAYPSTLLYKDFPKSVCTSVNNVACHGIPDDRPLQEGDIINVDVTVYYKGYHGDLSETYLVGDVDDRAQYLVDSCKMCRDEAISICGPGVPFFYIGTIIQQFAEECGFKVIPDFCGHGIGNYFHGPPNIFHFANTEPGEMKEGMTFTIEPILTEGDPAMHILKDGWTAVTLDNSRSAQFEHTILITSDGHEILTE